MLPVFKPGMTLIVSPNVPVNDGDEVYVQLLSGERLIKIARRVSDGWLLESTNPAYEPRFVQKSEVGAIHPVLYARRRRTPHVNGNAKPSSNA
jgi:phage repressor protein C with HTH and peptisase S24 domain